MTPTGSRPGDILCREGRIAAVLEPGSPALPPETARSDHVFDATGHLVFPGFIDPHVHSRDPGMTEKEDFQHLTTSAAAGGITTVLEMPNAIPPISQADILEQRAQYLEETAEVDFGLWGIALGRENLDALRDLINAGVVGIKLFWGYAFHRKTWRLVYNTMDYPTNELIVPPTSGEIYELFSEIADADGLLAAHCEDRHIIQSCEQRRSLENYEDFLRSRPEAAEANVIAQGIELSRDTGCRFHVVHTSSQRGVGLIRQAKTEGVRISAETCPQYLTLVNEDHSVIGDVMKVYPPIRSSKHRTALWEGVRDGSIDSLGSDHAPHTVSEKNLPLPRQPAGVIGVETMAPLLLDQVIKGAITPERLAWVMSEGTARTYGIFPQKGSILVGTDADFTVVDMNADWTIRNESLHSKNPVSPWHGTTGRGRPVATIVRGEIAMRNGEPTRISTGRFLRRLVSRKAIPH